jgi:hypothetical protein
MGLSSTKWRSSGIHALPCFFCVLIFLCCSSFLSIGSEPHTIELWKINLASATGANPEPTATPIVTDGLTFITYETLEQSVKLNDISRKFRHLHGATLARTFTSVQTGTILKNLGARAQLVDMASEGFVATVVAERTGSNPRSLTLTITCQGVQTRLNIWEQQDALLAVPDSTTHGGVGLYLVRIASPPDSVTQPEQKEDGPLDPVSPPNDAK